MLRYDLQENLCLSHQWMGTSIRAFWSQPAFAFTPSPMPSLLAAWGQVTARAFSRMRVVPEWNIESRDLDGHGLRIHERMLADKAFCSLVRFSIDIPDRSIDAVPASGAARPQILLVAPLSGHHSTLARKTVASLLPVCDVSVTEWKDARSVPLTAGRFDIEDYTRYLVEFMQLLGPDIHVIAVCQPAPLALAATAILAAADGDATCTPKSLTLIGGPVDPDANPTDITDFGNRFTMGQLESGMIQTVGRTFPGAGRRVYPGAVQLASFLSMNWPTHAQAFSRQIRRVARGDDREDDRHNSFYDEYFAVMDMTAEFYLSTVERIFKGREIARNAFSVGGEPVDINRISETAVMVVEGGRDDISAPGQCLAAFDLLPNLPDSMRESILDPDAGHYGVFSGRAWRERIRPRVLAFIDRHNC
ncbi:MAG: polyhydroxyalkanoate depolymerase [Paracoccaceae bacterium]|nr:polyhydroxyalkanoate depolymerase [Paracoccaceae bacterium]